MLSTPDPASVPLRFRSLWARSLRGLWYLPLVLASMVLAVRAFDLVTVGYVPSSHGEQTWTSWAVGPAGLREDVLRAVAEHSPDGWQGAVGQELTVVPPANARPELIQVLVRYVLVGADVLLAADVAAVSEVDGAQSLDLRGAGQLGTRPSTTQGPRVGGLVNPGSGNPDSGNPDSGNLDSGNLDSGNQEPGSGQLRWPRPSALDLLFTMVGLGVMVLCGSWLASTCGGLAFRLGYAVIGGALGWSIFVCVGGFVASMGLALSRPVCVGLWTLLLVFSFRFRAERPPSEAPPSRSSEREALFGWLGGLIVTGVLLAAWKAWLAPLWSWDHFAIWGVKSRLLVLPGGLELMDGWPMSAPHYPLGVPAAYALISGGGEMTPSLIKLVHSGFVAGVVLLTWRAALALGIGHRAALCASLGVSLLPLCWSTENLGLAELPLALGVLLAIVLLDGLRSAPSTRKFLLAGTVLGGLVFSKDEGLVLAVGLLLLGLVMCPSIGTRSPSERRLVTLLSAWPALALFGVWTSAARFLHRASGTSFLSGSWRERLAERWSNPELVLKPLASELLRFENLGIWLLLVPTLVLALVLRRVPAALVTTWALLQLSAYVGVFFVTYLEPEAHIVSSLARISGALEPLLVLGLVALLVPTSPTLEPKAGVANSSP